jgi:hypothetical protein
MQIATELYSSENEEWLPPIGWGVLPDVRLFTDFLEPYVGSTEMWLCPTGDPNPAVIGSGNGMILHYGINLYWYDDVDGDGIENHLRGLSAQRVRAIRYPDRVIYIADADPTSSPENIGGAESGTTDWPLTSLAETRHTGGYQAFYLSGAATWFPNKPNHIEWAARAR